MPVHNHELSAVFQRLADLLEIQGADRFRVRAYRNAARTIESHPGSIADMVQKERDIQALPGIGRDLADKIREYVKTGRLRLLEDLEKEIPRGLITLTALGSIGPKRARALYEELGVSSLEELAECARRGEIARIRGFGAKTERKILEEIAG
ncbi:MAG: helix-hairpin-helix domain-containing protein, partial [Desulfomonilia bacterium]